MIWGGQQLKILGPVETSKSIGKSYLQIKDLLFWPKNMVLNA